MTFTNYSLSNNASSTLLADITASATMILIKDWDQSIFPTTTPFLVTLEHLNPEWNVTTREIVKVINISQNTLIVERWAWTCVQDDTATNRVQWNSPHIFYAWDKVSLYRTAENANDIQNELCTITKMDAVADEYDSTSSYTTWDICMYKWERFECISSTTWNFDPTKWTKISVQWNIEEIETDVETLQTNVDDIMTNWVPTLSLTKQLFVWETYTKWTDEIFLQVLPRQENCTLWLAIWDVDAHKELHIQNALWEWTSNTISLKVRKIWSPTTSLIVKVQPWVLYTVSWTEKWWTGSWTDIASWSIAYTAITDTWQVLNVTLDNWIWWSSTPSIVDIVLSQTDWIINADNYYEIAYDSTQFSECFRWIYVNSASKVASKLMPYIACWWLLNCACVRYSSSSYAFWTSETRGYDHYLSKTSGWAYINIFSEWVAEPTYISIRNPTWTNRWSYSNPYWFAETYGDWMNFFLEVLNSSWVVVENYQFQYNQSEPICVCLPVWYTARTKSYTSRTYTGMTAYVTTQTIISTQWASSKKNSDWVSIFPNEQKSITTMGKFSITWLVDWPVWPQLFKWDYEQISPFKWTANSATTGSITLGTAVWYVIVDVNWTQVKVPYYNL